METNRSRHNRVKKCAVIDTNVFIYSFLQKVDLPNTLKEYGINLIYVPKNVIDELELLKKEGGKIKIAAKLSLDFINKNCKVLNLGNTKTDDALLLIARKFGCILITNDKKLKKKAKDNGIQIGYVSLSRLIIESEF